MPTTVAVLDVSAGGTDSALFPDQAVHSLSVENLTALPLRVRVIGLRDARALLLVIEGGPVPLFQSTPRAAPPQN